MFPLVYGTLAGGGYSDTDVQAIIAAMSPTPSAARQDLINTLVTGLKSDLSLSTLSAGFDLFYMFAADVAANALINWVSPGTYNASAVSSPSFTVDQGYTGNGASSYLTTNYTPSTNGVRYMLNSASCGSYSRSAITADARTDIGSGQGTASQRVFINARNSANAMGTCLNTDATISAGVSSSGGLSAVNRSASNLSTMYKNGSSIGTSANASTAVPASPILICAFNNAGTPTQFSTRQIAFAFAGKSFDATAHLAIFTRVEAFLDAIGAGVV